MDDEDVASLASRFRSPCFNPQETKALLRLVDKYKVFVLNKSTTATSCRAKDVAWSKIVQEFNKLGLGPERPAESLRMKWHNIKREIRRHPEEIFQAKYGDLSPWITKFMREADAMDSVDVPPLSLLESDLVESESEDRKQADEFEKIFADDTEKMSEYESDDSQKKGIKNPRHRSSNFSPQECQILVQCVRKEKKHIFSKESTSKMLRLKNAAWRRVTNDFNKLSPEKRSTRSLHDKFNSMKKAAKAGRNLFKGMGWKEKHEKLIEDRLDKVKEEPNEPMRQYTDSDSENDDDMAEAEYNHCSPVQRKGFCEDPLSSVLNGDSGIGFPTTETVASIENEEIVKLQKELLNYKLETAKMERQRVQRRIQEEALEHESLATERALRLRAARLNVAAAEARLPNKHPALVYAPDEVRAQRYAGSRIDA